MAIQLPLPGKWEAWVDLGEVREAGGSNRAHSTFMCTYTLTHPNASPGAELQAPASTSGPPFTAVTLLLPHSGIAPNPAQHWHRPLP